uniref:Uncharacterized protein n=1 Tax=Anguilla anguilla TaxID=7936 RepID=A0A0E9X6Q7_ANGAN
MVIMVIDLQEDREPQMRCFWRFSRKIITLLLHNSQLNNKTVIPILP